jgi:hypothetical protein
MIVSFSFSLFKWSEDEKLCARCVTNEAHFYEDGNFGILHIFVALNACYIQYDVQHISVLHCIKCTYILWWLLGFGIYITGT